MAQDTRQKLQLDYQSVCAYFLHLADVRFKLLAALPALSVGALLVLPEKSASQFSAGSMGFLVTLAIGIYDQRNTQIYDRLVLRARCLEHELGLPDFRRLSPTGGGAFLDRPRRRGKVIWHDLALGIVYAASLGAWSFIATRAAISLLLPELAGETDALVRAACIAALPPLGVLDLAPAALPAATVAVATSSSALVAAIALAVQNDLECSAIFDRWRKGLADVVKTKA